MESDKRENIYKSPGERVRFFWFCRRDNVLRNHIIEEEPCNYTWVMQKTRL